MIDKINLQRMYSNMDQENVMMSLGETVEKIVYVQIKRFANVLQITNGKGIADVRGVGVVVRGWMD